MGTTDIHYKGNPAVVASLLAEAAALFPRSSLFEEAVLYTLAGRRVGGCIPRGEL